MRLESGAHFSIYFFLFVFFVYVPTGLEEGVVV